MKVVLELHGQRSNVQRVIVRHDIVIGRSSDCNLCISAPQVSRRHCFLRVGTDAVAVTDLDSINGTWLNGERTVPGKRYFVDDGMTIAVGPIRFVARISEDVPVIEMVQDDNRQDSVVPVTPIYESAIPPNPSESGSMDFSVWSTQSLPDEDKETADYVASGEELGVVEPIEVVEAIEWPDGDKETADYVASGEELGVAEAIEVETGRAAELIDGVDVVDNRSSAMEAMSSAELMAVESVDDEISSDAQSTDTADPQIARGDPVARTEAPDTVNPANPPNASWFGVDSSADPELDEFLRRNPRR